MGAEKRLSNTTLSVCCLDYLLRVVSDFNFSLTMAASLLIRAGVAGGMDIFFFQHFFLTIADQFDLLALAFLKLKGVWRNSLIR